jgi:hypothetical protein
MFEVYWEEPMTDFRMFRDIDKALQRAVAQSLDGR